MSTAITVLWGFRDIQQGYENILAESSFDTQPVVLK